MHYDRQELQAYYDKTMAHLVAQGRRAVDLHGETCLYLTPDGLKCAVGVHIPDGHPAQNFQGSLSRLAESRPELQGVAWPRFAMDLAHQLQCMHDDGHNWSEAGFLAFDEARKIAEEYGLTPYPAPTGRPSVGPSRAWR